MESDQCIELLAIEPAHTVLCSDFDGTLAVVVKDPTTAAAVPGAINGLERLAGTLAIVAIVSGRSVTFLEEHFGGVGSPRIELYGRFGAEHRDRAGTLVTLEISPALRHRLVEIGNEAAASIPGILIEDKGTSLSLHWRGLPEAEVDVLALVERHAALGDLEAREGKMIIELVPKGASTKGRALRALCGPEVRTCCYIGDDVSDLDAFDFLDEFEALGGTGIRIAVDSIEMPQALRERADLVLGSPIAVGRFLNEAADRLS